jgi:ABC-2 type transport system permease protein
VAQLDDRPDLSRPARPGPARPDFTRPDLASSAYAIPASTQLLAIAWLRWRIFVNGFRRQAGSGKVAGLVVSIVLRVMLWPIVALWVVGPAVGSGFLAWMAVDGHHPQRLSVLFGGIALIWQLIAINGTGIAATVSSFDPSTLLRFPLRFGRYLVLRLLLGLMTASTIVGCLALFAAAIGITVAQPSLAAAAFVVLAIFAAMNIFLSRMIAVWMERWLSTRRAREIFTALMALFFVSFQLLNFHRPLKFRHPTGHPSARANSWLNFLSGTHPFLNWLPPGFATNSIFPLEHPLARLAQFAALLAWTGLFLAAFAFRLHKQFLGEYLSEGAPRSAPKAPRSHPPASTPAPAAVFNQQLTTSNQQLLSPTIAACLRKEWVYLRGNTNQLIQMFTPLVFVFIFARGILARHPAYLLSGAVGYALLGLLGTLYNVFGADAAGVQLYLLAPVRLRDVIVAKNIASLALLLVETALAWTIVMLLATAPITLSSQFSAAFWIVFVVFANLTLGTMRSIQAPRKILPGQARQLRSTSTSRTSALIVLATLFGCILLQVPVALLSGYFHNPWLAVWIFAPLAAAAVAVYALMLANADRLILTHRDLFAADLCGD